MLRRVAVANLERVLDVFRRLDVDASGEVDRKEFRVGLKALQIDTAAKDVDELFDLVDASRSGHISYRELFQSMRISMCHN